MDLINIIGSYFFDSYQLVKSSEDFECFNFELSSNVIKELNKEELNGLMAFIRSRDSYKLSISTYGLQDSSINHNTKDLTEFFVGLDKIKFVCETDNKIFLYFTLIKNYNVNEKKILSIYSSNTFINSLKQKDITALLFTISKAMLGINSLFIENIEGGNFELFTGTILAINKSEIKNDINRKDLLNKRNQECNFLNASELFVLPDDFNLADKISDKFLNDLFNKLLNVVSLFFIANISELKEDRIIISIEGFKKHLFDLKISDLCDDGKDFYNIYKWIYNEGNISDKIKLARSIISINIDSNFNLNKGTLDSIKSNFNIYLKENVKQYIEVKNKISEFIYDLSQKATNIVDDLTQQLRSNVIGFLTFFITIIIFNSISANKFENIFTKDITTISYSLLIISFIYLVVSLFLVRQQVNRLKVQYNSVKERYNDLLDPNDIERIFNNDENLNKDLSYIFNKSSIILCFWIILLIILGSAIYYLHK
jgi:hypothetical protein